MNKSRELMEKLEDLEELEEIRKFENELEKEYGPIVARGEKEIIRLSNIFNKKRLSNDN